MFIPIVIDPCSFYDYRYLWEYLKNLYHCRENGWPIIAGEEYKYYKERRKISNVYEENFTNMHQYRILTPAEEKKVKKYFIPESVYKDLMRKEKSKLGCKLFLLKSRYKPFERVIKKIICKIKKDFHEPIEGFLIWNSCYKSIRYLAGKSGIPIITNEFSIRFPEFYPLSYFCLEDIYGQREIYNYYQRFLKEKKAIKTELLTREELLALFLDAKRTDIFEDREAIYEMGIAGCHPLIATFFSKSTYTDLELIEDVRLEYSEDDILFRKHPGDEPYQADYTLRNKDDSLYASTFIKKCKRITAHGSNILLEAMLWGKPIYSRDISPFTCFGEISLHNKNTARVSDEVLNFILLVYLVPYNKVWDENFIRWRLREKRTDQIYKANLEYYFREMDYPIEILRLNREERIQRMIKLRREKRNG